ncbi:MAG: hypothetical protein UH080_08025 [Ruminococcus sp.]|nr:hypothetical protein [Ruminococcus sp.]
MIALSEDVKKYLLNDSTYREIIIRFPDATEGEIAEIGSDNIIADSFELTNSICDESDFCLGGCIVSQMSVKVIGIEQELNNKRINVFLRQGYSMGYLYPSDDLFPSDDLYPTTRKGSIEVQLFSGTIDSSLRQKNRSVKEIIAFDDLYKASQIYAYNWFTSLAQYSPKISMYNLRVALVDKFINDYSYDIEFNGINDDKSLSLNLDYVKTVCDKKLTVLDLLQAYCELNACFCVMDGTGKIKFIQLTESQTEVIENYSELTFEEFVTTPINLIKFPYKNDNVFAYGNTGVEKQSWYISDNILSSCCEDISEIIESFNINNFFGYVFTYRPFTADVFARWWIESGDRVLIKTGYNDTEVVESFVFSRTLKGINGMRNSIQSQGTEFLGKDEINELQSSELEF